MPYYKLVIRYKFATKGWTEVFYRESAVALQAATLNDAFIVASLACRNPGTILQSVTASDVAIPRDSYIIKHNRVAPGIPGSSPDVTNTAVRLNLNFFGSGGRKLWLRGLNDTWTIRDDAGNTALAAALVTRIQTYITQIIGVPLLGRKIKDVTVNPFSVVGLVGEGAIAGKPWTQFATQDNLNLVAGDKVYLSGFPQTTLGGLKGIFTVLASTGAAATFVNYAWQLSNATIIPPNAKARKAAFDYPLIIAGQVDDLSSHDTGVPTDRPRGRRRGLIVRR